MISQENSGKWLGLAWGARGRGFESRRPDHFFAIIYGRHDDARSALRTHWRAKYISELARRMVESLIPLSLRLQHPCREFVFQPKYAADLNLIE